MTSRTETLYQLFKDCLFAPNYNKLAVRLGLNGRMNIARLMKEPDSVGDRACNSLWEQVIERFGVQENLMPHLHEVWELSNELKHNIETLSIELSPTDQTCPEDMTEEQWQRVCRLYQTDQMLYFILLSIVYAKRAGINPYAEKNFSATIQLVSEIDARLHAQYPQHQSAHDMAQALLQVMNGRDNDCWWLLGYFGGAVIRLYHNPQYVQDMLERLSRPMPFPDWQWWREKDGDRQTLWYWQKNGSTGAVYYIVRIENSQTVSESVFLMAEFIKEHLVWVEAPMTDGTEGLYMEWEMQTDENGLCTLHLQPEIDCAVARLLPSCITMLRTTDEADLVNRAIALTEDMQKKCVENHYRIMNLQPTDRYRLTDIECGRRHVRIWYGKTGEKAKAAVFQLEKYPVLKAITANSAVELCFGLSDSKLYAFWSELGLLLPLE